MPTSFRSRTLAAYLQTLEEAIRYQKRVTIVYDHHRPAEPVAEPPQSDAVPQALPPMASDRVSPVGAPRRSTRDVDPYGLVYRQGAWLLVGHCHQARAVRRFRVDRMLDLQVAPKPRTPDFEVPKDFSLQAEGSFSPWCFDRGPRLEVRLFVSNETHWVAKEDFGPARRSPGEDRGQEGTIVEFSCANLDYLVSRVLGAAGALRVLAPETLRRRIADAALQVARRNLPSGAQA